MVGMDDIGNVLFLKAALSPLLVAVGDDLLPLAVTVFLREAAHNQLSRHFVERLMLALRCFLHGKEEGVRQSDVELARHSLIVAGERPDRKPEHWSFSENFKRSWHQELSIFPMPASFGPIRKKTGTRSRERSDWPLKKEFFRAHCNLM